MSWARFQADPALLKLNVWVLVVDVVSTSSYNLDANLLRFLESSNPALGMMAAEKVKELLRQLPRTLSDR
jgi:hypothetical protein